jgi:transposase
MKEKKTTKPRRRYESEFKESALQMVENGRSVPSVSQALGISEGLLYTWKSKAKKKMNSPDKGEEDELKVLRKRMKELEQERDILKKALSIFSRQT